MIEQIYPHPPERVWQALTDPAALAEWLMPNTFEPRLGHQFRFWTTPRPGFDGVVNCQVTVLEPPHRLAFTWQGEPLRQPTLVTFLLQPAGTGTQLRLEHTGFEGPGGFFVRTILSRGWPGLLRRALARLLTSDQLGGHR